MVRIFINTEHNTQATLERWSDGTWFVNMGCNLWNRIYKSERWAIAYLTKNGYQEVGE